MPISLLSCAFCNGFGHLQWSLTVGSDAFFRIDWDFISLKQVIYYLKQQQKTIRLWGTATADQCWWTRSSAGCCVIHISIILWLPEVKNQTDLSLRHHRVQFRWGQPPQHQYFLLLVIKTLLEPSIPNCGDMVTCWCQGRDQFSNTKSYFHGIWYSQA